MGLANIAMGVGRTKPSGSAPSSVVDIITFAESDWGLGCNLFPAQRVILKAFYGIPLNDTDKTVPVSDWRRQSWAHMTEADYLRKLFDDGRSSIREVVPGDERHELVLSIGRRSGKTLMASVIATYETYKLLLKGCPQKYYGLPTTNEIGIASVATDKKQAGILYTNVSGYFADCSFFSQYMANSTLSFAKLQTPYDIERYGRFNEAETTRSSIFVSFHACVAKGLRGPGNIVIILDELAHFVDEGQSSAELVYNAITPSKSAFSPKDPNSPQVPTGPVEGRVISISSPLGRQGQFYSLFEIAMRGSEASKDMLAIQAPTWEVNPTVPATEFEKHYLKNQTVFFTEYGAEFTDRTRGWIERAEDLEACIDPTAKQVDAAPARRPHFIGIDLGMVEDASAVAIGHIEEREGEKVIIVDLVDQIKAGDGRFANVERLDFDDIADWIHQLSKRFYLAGGVFDQWAGIPFEQALAKRGLRQLVSEHMTKNLVSSIYQNFKDMMFDRRLVLYDAPIPPGKNHCDYIQELLELQAQSVSKYITVVEAPNIEGKHDDRSDALVRMVWLASQNITKPKYISRGDGATLSQRTAATANIREVAKAALGARKMGSHPSRQVSPLGRGRVLGRR
jgi:hypothetical protein